MANYIFEITQGKEGELRLVLDTKSTELTKAQVKELGLSPYSIEGFDRMLFNEHYKSETGDSVFKEAEKTALDIIGENCDEEEIYLQFGNKESFAACDDDMFDELVQSCIGSPDVSDVRCKFDERIVGDLKLYAAMGKELETAEIAPAVFKHVRNILAAYDDGRIQVEDKGSYIAVDYSGFDGNSTFGRDIICWDEGLRDSWDFKELVTELQSMYLAS